MDRKNLEAIYRRVTECRSCWTCPKLALADPQVDIAVPRNVGKGYETAPRRVLVMAINPGAGEARPGKNEELRDLARGFRDGSTRLDDLFAWQEDDMKYWGRGRYVPFYSTLLGLNLEDLAFANIAQCSTVKNRYPASFLQRCFEKHTKALLTELAPDVVLLSGSATHRFASAIEELLPGAVAIPMLHFAHRKGRDAEDAQGERVRALVATAGV